MGAMPYFFLLIAIGSEIIATSLLKYTEGFSRLWYTLACLLMYGIAFFMLSLAVRDIPVGVAYALWSGLGTAAIVAIGAMFLGEPITLVKVTGISLIVAGVLVLNLGGASSH